MAATDPADFAIISLFDCIGTGNGGRTFHLYYILTMWLLGISAYYHDSAAALINDGVIVAAAQEERFNRQKHYSGFPHSAVKYCLEEAGLTLSEVDNIVFYEKPLLRFERLLDTYLTFAPRGFYSFMRAMPLWLKEKIFQKHLLIKELDLLDASFTAKGRLLFAEHHLSHAASAFYPSPFERAIILIMDGVGEWATTSIMLGDGQTIQPLKEICFPHSLGLLYSAFTYYCGFRVNDGEYKLMGLAPYGTPRYVALIKEHLITLREDGSFRLNMKYFNYCTGLTMTSRHFHQLFGRGPRRQDDKVTQLDMDLACSIQQVSEEIILRIASAIRHEYGIEHLCLAGGVALNCVANGKIQKENIYKDIWIQPASGDAGASLGAALAAYHIHHQKPRTTSGSNRDAMKGGYLGPDYSNEQILEALEAASGISYQQVTQAELTRKAAQSLADGEVIGWFQGRMEFGPRALGSRSILGDPRSPIMQSLINQKVKFRESFRPFAPSVLREEVSEYFTLDTDSPYMLTVASINARHRTTISVNDAEKSGLELLRVQRSDIPAVTHVDYSARIHTVTESANPLYYHLIQQFKKITGIGLVVNTSFNVRDEPIVCTPQDAIDCFHATALDTLYIGSFQVRKI